MWRRAVSYRSSPHSIDLLLLLLLLTLWHTYAKKLLGVVQHPRRAVDTPYTDKYRAHIHGAIVAATVGAIEAATIACLIDQPTGDRRSVSLYTGRSPRRSLRPVAATIAPCIRPITSASLLEVSFIRTKRTLKYTALLNIALA